MSHRGKVFVLAVLCALVAAALAFETMGFGCSPALGPYIVNCSGASCGSQTGLSGGLGSTIIPYYWIAGSASAYNSSTCVANQDAIKKSGGQYQVFSSWGANDSGGGKVDCAYGCPSPAGTRMAYLYSNQATGNGDGSYILMSVLYNSNLDGMYNFYSITNGSGTPANNCATIALPAVTLTAVTPVSGGYSVTFTWPSIFNGTGFNQLRGYYDTDPLRNLLTGINIRYATGATAPTSDRSNYSDLGTLDVSGLVTDPGTATFTVPGPLSASTWFRIFFVFDNSPNIYTRWGGPVSGRLGPTPSGVFARQGAEARQGHVTVNWQSNVETNVAFFEVCYSTRKNGIYDPVHGLMVAAKGPNSEYCAGFQKPVRGQKLYYKVRATFFDGTSEWTPLIRAAASPPGRNLPCD